MTPSLFPIHSGTGTRGRTAPNVWNKIMLNMYETFGTLAYHAKQTNKQTKSKGKTSHCFASLFFTNKESKTGGKGRGGGVGERGADKQGEQVSFISLRERERE